MTTETETTPEPWRSLSCAGEHCRLCGRPAAAKVGEEIMHDDPFYDRHNLTAYVCADHFQALFGERGVAMVENWRRNPPTSGGAAA